MPNTQRRTRAALSPEARQQQLIAMAYDVAEKRLMEGKASSQEIVYLMRLGSRRERAEQRRIENQADFMSAKTKAIEEAESIDKLYSEAIAAMKVYSGEEVDYGDDSDLS